MKLKEYQRETVEFGLKNRYAIFGLDMGLGKSFCALSTWAQSNVMRLVIVAPAYLVKNWKREIKKCLGAHQAVFVVSKGSDLKRSITNNQIIVLSYGLVQKAEFLFDKKPFLIIDEAHSLASMNAKRTQFIHRVVFENSLPSVLLLTGTPIKNRVQEFYSLMALCHYNPRLEHSKFLDQFPDSITFADHFSVREEFDLDIGYKRVRIVKWNGVKRKDELRFILKNIYIRFLSGQVLDLDPIIYKDILISDNADPNLLAEFENHFSDDESRSVNPRFKAEAALRKVPFTVQYVKGLLDEGVGPVAVYTDHVDSARELARAFDCLPITGEMPPKKRLEVAQRFQRGEVQVLVATIKSFSTGVDLTRAKNLVLNDYSWVPGDLAQVIHRIQRIGQTSQCVVHKLSGSPQDLSIMNALEEKSKTISEVT